MFDIASVGKVHLDKARSPELKNNVPKEAIPALFPAVCHDTEGGTNIQAIADDFTQDCKRIILMFGTKNC